jgi:DNA-binding protein H-NS
MQTSFMRNIVALFLTEYAAVWVHVHLLIDRYPAQGAKASRFKFRIFDMAKRTAARKAPVAKAAPRKSASSRQNTNTIMYQLDDLSVPLLRAVAEKAQALIREKADSERRALIEDVTARAKGLGVSVKELFGLGEAKPGRKAGAKRGSPSVKYQGPNPQDQWSGRGRPPRWLQALEAEGRKRDEFLVGQ